MRTFYQPSQADLALPTVLAALSDPVRLRIVQLLATGEERACGAFGIPLAKPTLSHHFKVLRDAGVIAMRPSGTQHLSSLRRADLDACFPGLLDAVLAASATARADDGRHPQTEGREGQPVA